MSSGVGDRESHQKAVPYSFLKQIVSLYCNQCTLILRFIEALKKKLYASIPCHIFSICSRQSCFPLLAPTLGFPPSFESRKQPDPKVLLLQMYLPGYMKYSGQPHAPASTAAPRLVRQFHLENMKPQRCLRKPLGAWTSGSQSLHGWILPHVAALNRLKHACCPQRFWAVCWHSLQR